MVEVLHLIPVLLVDLVAALLDHYLVQRVDQHPDLHSRD
jgi:hypothetical protein